MLEIILSVSILVVSVVIHEVAHGWTAYLFGDPTAKNQGRLRLNPAVHVDPFGSVLLPLLLVVTGSPVLLGYAKPVPVRPEYFVRPIRDMMWVALAGPLSNVTIVAICGVVYKTWFSVAPSMLINSAILQFVFGYTITINLVLACFNLIPIPPLDGSRIVLPFLPYRAQVFLNKMEPYGFVIIFVLLYFGVLSWILQPLLRVGYRLLL